MLGCTVEEKLKFKDLFFSVCMTAHLQGCLCNRDLLLTVSRQIRSQLEKQAEQVFPLTFQVVVEGNENSSVVSPGKEGIEGELQVRGPSVFKW